MFKPQFLIYRRGNLIGDVHQCLITIRYDLVSLATLMGLSYLSDFILLSYLGQQGTMLGQYGNYC